jgi:hypothetical protein
MTEKANLGASVTARLLNQARASGDDYQTLLVAYAFERFLYRLGISPLRDRFLLKGAMLLRLWSDQPYRATRDLDLLRRGDGSLEAIAADLRAISSVPAPPDGVEFDGENIRVEAIRAEDEYGGVRAKLPASCSQARLVLQIDVGIGDSIWPKPRRQSYPTLLDSPAPDMLAYPREAVVAEKLEALVVLGDRNSRIKDFFDLHHLAASFEFDRVTLAEAVRRTFERRGTPIPDQDPLGLTPAYWSNPSRPAQVSAFARRAGLAVPDNPSRQLGDLLGSFLLPVLGDLKEGTSREGTWPPGGPWR